MALLLGLDIGSSSIKASVIDSKTGRLLASTHAPKNEMRIDSPKPGWAEQHPELWWENVIEAVSKLKVECNLNEIEAVGIAYQMHGLVLVDKSKEVLCPSIIWCDSRAIEMGSEITNKIGKENYLNKYLNLPGNFTLSKLLWVKKNLPEVYNRVYKFILPGDFIAMKLTGEINTTPSGLSEGIMWNFEEGSAAHELFKILNIHQNLKPDLVPTFGIQGRLTKKAAEALGMKQEIPVSYRAGDQPNNAFSLNVLSEGEAAATAGTSGVVYAVTSKKPLDKLSRVNIFAHVNYNQNDQYKGVLLCINGTGILYRWLRSVLFSDSISYETMNKIAAEIPIGADGLQIFPFGNGAERILNNKITEAELIGLNFNRHSKSHIIRAALEGIAFSFRYGLEIMSSIGVKIEKVKVGNANLFLSSEFVKIFSNVCDVTVEIYNTDGAEGAARGAGVGSGHYENFSFAFSNLKIIENIKPSKNEKTKYNDFYNNWKKKLEINLKS